MPKAKKKARKGHKKKSKTSTKSSRPTNKHISDDLNALISRSVPSFPKPPLKNFVYTDAQIEPGPEVNLNSSQMISFFYYGRPNELLSFPPDPFWMLLKFVQTTNGTKSGWVEDDSVRKVMVLPEFELQTLFSHCDITIDGTKIPSGLGTHQMEYDRMCYLFKERGEEEFKTLLRKTRQYEDADFQMGQNYRTWRERNETTNENDQLSFRGGFNANFPMSVQSPATKALTNHNLDPIWIHPGSTLRIDLHKRPKNEMLSMLCVSDGTPFKARNNKNQSAVIDLSMYDILIEKINIQIKLWRPDDRRLLETFQNLKTNRYVAEFASFRMYQIPENFSYWNQSFPITSDTKVGYLIFRSASETFAIDNKTQITPVFSFPTEIKRIQFRLNGMPVHWKSGFIDPGQPVKSVKDPSNASYVSWLHSSKLWPKSDVKSFFLEEASDKHMAACHVFVFNFCETFFGDQTAMLECELWNSTGFKQQYNALFFSTQSKQVVCTKLHHDSYSWECIPNV